MNIRIFVIVLLSVVLIACGKKSSMPENTLAAPVTKSIDISTVISTNPSPSIAQDVGIYAYEPAITTLRGTLTWKTEEMRNGETTTFPVLQLSQRISVVESPPDDPAESGVVRIELMMKDDDRATYSGLKSVEVAVTGTLFHAFNDYHRTRVLMKTKSISNLAAVAFNIKPSSNFNQELISLWKCSGNGGEKNGKEIEMGEFEFYKDSTFIHHYATTDLGFEMYNFGRYILLGKKLNITFVADKFLAPVKTVGSWKYSAKAKVVGESNSYTEENDDLKIDSDQLMMWQIRRVNWDGKDSQETGQLVKCTKVSHISFMNIRNSVPDIFVSSAQ